MADGGLAPTEGGSEDGITGGPKTPQQIAAHRRLQQTQAKVDEVVNIMSTNVEKVLDRDHKLSELDGRAEALQQGASQFEQQAGKLKRKFWLQNLKMIIIGGVIGVIIIALIASSFMSDNPKDHFTRKESQESAPVNPNPAPQPKSATNETPAATPEAPKTEQPADKAGPPPGNKRLIADLSYLLKPKY